MGTRQSPHFTLDTNFHSQYQNVASGYMRDLLTGAYVLLRGVMSGELVLGLSSELNVGLYDKISPL